MPDPTTRSAAQLATLIAIPVALLVGIGTFLLLRPPADDGEPAAAPTSTAPATMPTSPVEMPAPALTERAELVCRALVSQLPTELDGLPQRPVTAGPEQNAAYGEPPITVACGGEPVEYEPTDQVYPWEGVCWRPDPESGDPDPESGDPSVWTALGREVPIRVTVPASYDGPFQYVLEFSRPIAETVRSTEAVPAGCTD
ncbi:MAG TPA: DUF3515 domain-containing protein [Natronosporangium sp.]